MSLDISYQGLPLLRQTSGRFEDGGLFVPSDAPMPVATALSLRVDGAAGTLQAWQAGESLPVSSRGDGSQWVLVQPLAGPVLLR